MQINEVIFLLADRIWVAVALLHQEFPLREDFSKDEIRQKMRDAGFMNGLKPGSIAARRLSLQSSRA